MDAMYDLGGDSHQAPATTTPRGREHRRRSTRRILARLADVLAASIIRAWVECACGDESQAKQVAKVKMFQARQWIGQEGRRIPVVANRLGYDSEASFSRAFQRVIGHPPSAARGTPTPA